MKGYEEWNNSSSIGERNAGQHSSTGNGQAASATPVDLPGNPTADPDWLLVEEGFTLARQHEIESLLTTANGYLGTRGSLAERGSLSAPATFVAGVFARPAAEGAIPQLVPIPDWTHLCVVVHGHPLTLESHGTLDHRRVLDFRQGILWREWRYRDPAGRVTRLRSLRLASLADRHVLLQSVTLTAEDYSGHVRLESVFPHTAPHTEFIFPARPAPSAMPGVALPEVLVAAVRAAGTGTVVALAAAHLLRHDEGVSLRHETIPGTDASLLRWDVHIERGTTVRLDRLICLYTSREATRPLEAALTHLGRLCTTTTVEGMVEAHRRAWAERWQAADVQVQGDPEAQRALRFAVYHLVSAVNPEDERVSVGARALTGKGYKGHVFWDTEIYLLPFYVFTYPSAARALLRYRYHTLPAAREKARALGYRGALYAWESADDGRETTPAAVRAPDGTVIRILSGEQEHHVSADIAYGVWLYWQVTRDEAFLRDAGAEILLETARFWASRAHLGPDGHYHIARVIGPDEYHEGVDDNAYTNVMAQWNLERGAEVARLLRRRWPAQWQELRARLRLAPREPEEWEAVARKMYTGLDPRTGLFEQFRGYFDLEPVDLTAYEPRTAPMDILLGRERTQRSQVIKQADVVLLSALLWERFPRRVHETNFRYYAPRTGHGSSLSPTVYALVAARLGDTPLAERYFRQAAAIDLANNMGNAAAGVHIAALGGLWQVAVLGFAGLRLRPDGIVLAPRLPASWQCLRFPVRWRDRQLVVTLRREPHALEIQLDGPGPLAVEVEGGPCATIQPGRRSVISREGAGWGPWREAP